MTVTVYAYSATLPFPTLIALTIILPSVITETVTVTLICDSVTVTLQAMTITGYAHSAIHAMYSFNTYMTVTVPV